MANLNLSQFTEKTLVADADWVFVWDTAGSISKKVSRNSLLNSGTLATSAPVTISQTWNDAAVAFTAFKVNATSTNSAAGSLLLDLQVGGVSKFNVDKVGNITIPAGSFIGNAVTALALGGGNFYPQGTSGATSTLGTVGAPFFGIWLGASSQSAFLTSDSLNTLALRNSTAPQTFRVYNTYSNAGADYERGEFVWSGSTFYVQTINLGTGQTRPISFGGQSMAFRTNSGSGLTERMAITAAGNVGIGTTAPAAKLEVVGTILVNGATQIIDDGNILSVKGSTTNVFKAGYIVVTSGDNLVTTYQGSVLSGGFFGTFTNHSLNIRTNNVERVTIAAAGNVGIGTTAPSSKLQVTGGDVEIETVTSGIIMKAAGTSTRYRITLNATGDALVFTAV
jgi:hypothetical protein